MRNLRIHICRAVIGKKTQIILRRLPANRYIDLANGKARICPQFARALGRQPRPSKPIGCQKLRGNPLLHFRIAVNTCEKGNFRMNMHIDKTGTDDMPRRVNNRIGLCLRQIANGLNAIPTNANIRLKTGRSARTVNHCAVANNEIKSHFLPPVEFVAIAREKKRIHNNAQCNTGNLTGEHTQKQRRDFAIEFKTAKFENERFNRPAKENRKKATAQDT